MSSGALNGTSTIFLRYAERLFPPFVLSLNLLGWQGGYDDKSSLAP